jgi:hypothetical protein
VILTVKGWKKRLEKIYNIQTVQKELILGWANLLRRKIAHLFGMRSIKALSLFNQVVGVKCWMT